MENEGRRKKFETQDAFWKSIIQKYEARNQELEKEQLGLQHKIDQLDANMPAVMAFNMAKLAQGQPDADVSGLVKVPCTCTDADSRPKEKLRIPDMSKASVFSIEDEDVHYMDRIKELTDQEKKLIDEVNKLRSKEKAIKDAKKKVEKLCGQDKKGGKCSVDGNDMQKMNEKLLDENRTLNHEIADLKLEMKHIRETVEGPLSRELDRERRRSLKLEAELKDKQTQETASMGTVQRELDFLREQLKAGDRNLRDMVDINNQLKCERDIIERRMLELQNDLINQKISEANCLAILKTQLAKPDDPCGKGKDGGGGGGEDGGGGGGGGNGGCPCLRKPKCTTHGSLYAIARDLSNELNEAQENKGVPDDLKDTVNQIKSLCDLIDQNICDDPTKGDGDLPEEEFVAIADLEIKEEVEEVVVKEEPVEVVEEPVIEEEPPPAEPTPEIAEEPVEEPAVEPKQEPADEPIQEELDEIPERESKEALPEEEPVKEVTVKVDSEYVEEVEAVTELEAEPRESVQVKKISDGLNVTTTITRSGMLEVVTEGPAGMIETTLTVTESGNVEVVTEYTELTAAPSMDKKTCMVGDEDEACKSCGFFRREHAGASSSKEQGICGDSSSKGSSGKTVQCSSGAITKCSSYASSYKSIDDLIAEDAQQIVCKCSEEIIIEEVVEEEEELSKGSSKCSAFLDEEEEPQEIPEDDGGQGDGSLLPPIDEEPDIMREEVLGDTIDYTADDEVTPVAEEKPEEPQQPDHIPEQLTEDIISPVVAEIVEDIQMPDVPTEEPIPAKESLDVKLEEPEKPATESLSQIVKDSVEEKAELAASISDIVQEKEKSKELLETVSVAEVPSKKELPLDEFDECATVDEHKPDAEGSICDSGNVQPAEEHKPDEQSIAEEVEAPKPEVESAVGEVVEPKLEEESAVGEVVEPKLEEESAVGEVVEPKPEEESAVGEVLEPKLEEESAVGEVLEPKLEEESAVGEVVEPKPEEESAVGEVLEPKLEEESAAGEVLEPKPEEESAIGDVEEPKLEDEGVAPEVEEPKPEEEGVAAEAEEPKLEDDVEESKPEAGEPMAASESEVVESVKEITPEAVVSMQEAFVKEETLEPESSEAIVEEYKKASLLSVIQEEVEEEPAKVVELVDTGVETEAECVCISAQTDDRVIICTATQGSMSHLSQICSVDKEVSVVEVVALPGEPLVRTAPGDVMSTGSKDEFEDAVGGSAKEDYCSSKGSSAAIEKGDSAKSSEVLVEAEPSEGKGEIIDEDSKKTPSVAEDIDEASRKTSKSSEIEQLSESRRESVSGASGGAGEGRPERDSISSVSARRDSKSSNYAPSAEVEKEPEEEDEWHDADDSEFATDDKKSSTSLPTQKTGDSEQLVASKSSSHIGGDHRKSEMSFSKRSSRSAICAKKKSSFGMDLPPCDCGPHPADCMCIDCISEPLKDEVSLDLSDLSKICGCVGPCTCTCDLAKTCQCTGVCNCTTCPSKNAEPATDCPCTPDCKCEKCRFELPDCDCKVCLCRDCKPCHDEEMEELCCGCLVCACTECKFLRAQLGNDFVCDCQIPCDCEECLFQRKEEEEKAECACDASEECPMNSEECAMKSDEAPPPVVASAVVDKTPKEASEETPAEVTRKAISGVIPVQSPEESPAEIPVETPTEAPVESPEEARVERSVESPEEAPVERSVESPEEAPVERPAEAPGESPAEGSEEGPVESPVADTAEIPEEMGDSMLVGDLTEETDDAKNAKRESLTRSSQLPDLVEIPETPEEIPSETPAEGVCTCPKGAPCRQDCHTSNIKIGDVQEPPPTPPPVVATIEEKCTCPADVVPCKVICEDKPKASESVKVEPTAQTECTCETPECTCEPQYRKQVDELNELMDQIKCACQEAETVAKPPLIKQASDITETLSNLEVALEALQQKSETKDVLIDALKEELRLRAKGAQYGKIIDDMFTNKDDVCDYDRSTLAESLPKPLDKGMMRFGKLPASCVCGVQKDQQETCECKVNASPLQIVDIRRIGPGSILLKWIPANSNQVMGYEICIDGVVKSRVFSPRRTSAIVDGLSMKNSIDIAIFATCYEGRCKPAATAVYKM